MNSAHDIINAAYEDLNHGSFSSALTKAKKVHEIFAKSLETFLLLIEIYEAKNDYDQALDLTDEALKKYPNNQLLLLKKASLLMDEFGDLEEAFLILKDLLKDLDNQPKTKDLTKLDLEIFLDAHALMIDYYRLANQYDKALEIAKKCVEYAPKSKRAIVFLATQLFEMGDFKKAHSLIETPDLKNEHFALFLKAQILQAESNFEQADKIFFKLAKKDKDFHTPERIPPKDFSDAVEKALNLYPDSLKLFKEKISIKIIDIVPKSYLEKHRGTISPLSQVIVTKDMDQKVIGISLVQKNIENLAENKEQIIKIIESEIIHGIVRSQT